MERGTDFVNQRKIVITPPYLYVRYVFVQGPLNFHSVSTRSLPTTILIQRV